MLRTHRRGEISILIIIFLLVIIIGLVVWYAFWGKPKAQVPTENANPIVSASVAVDPYDGWKSYTLKYEKFTFKYPADWTLVDYSQADTSSDGVAVKSKDGFILRFSTNIWGVGGGCPECKNFEMSKETILGATTGVNIFGTDQGAGGIGLQRGDTSDGALLTCTGLCAIPGTNATTTLNGNKPGLISVVGSYLQNFDDASGIGWEVRYLPYANFKADPNVATARKIFSSMSY